MPLAFHFVRLDKTTIKYIKQICFKCQRGDKEMTHKVLALDIGGTSIRIAVVEGKNIKNYQRVPTPNNKDQFLERINLLISNQMSKDIKGIGIGFPSPIKNGVIKNPPNLHIKDFDLKGYLEKKFKKRVEIYNDAGCAAIAESVYGNKKKNFIVVTLGTGVGGGIIINGKPYRGTGYGSEIGHIMIKGKQLEKHWQETRRKYKKLYGEEMLMRDLLKIKTKESKNLLEEMSDYMGQGLASLVSVLDPEVIVLSGGIKECGPKLLSYLQKGLDKYTFLPKKTKIVWTTLEHPGTLGASLLIK